MSELIKEKNPFGMVPNSLLNNETISLKAKGLFAFMQSKPQGWNFSVKLIATQSKDSIDSVTSGLKELETNGYLEREKRNTSTGFITIYKLTFNVVSHLGKSHLGKSHLGKSHLGKSLNNSNKELSNKDKSKKEREEALAFFESNFPSDFEVLMMQYKSRINDFVKFSEMFDATVEQEGLSFEHNVLSGRFKKFARNWIDNQTKYDRVIKIEDESPVYSKLKIS